MFKKLLAFLNSFRAKETGAIGDNRTLSQIENAYDSRELVSATEPLKWEEVTDWTGYPVKRQWYTLSCVAQSLAKHLGINNFYDTGKYIDLSAEFIYSHRINKPSGGMVWLDSMKIATTIGSCPDLMIKQRIRETDKETPITAEMINEALKYIGKAFIEDKERTIESISRIIDVKGSCLMWFWFDKDGEEWWRAEPQIIYPNLGTYSAKATRHAVIGTKRGLRKAKEVVKIEDSAGNGSAINDQDRFIDENFIKRCFVAGYVIDLPNEIPNMDKPKFTGTRTLRVGDKGNDVKELQTILEYYGFFPSTQTKTGYYGGITRMGVIKLQEKFASEILHPLGLVKGTGIVGNSTLAWLQKNHK